MRFRVGQGKDLIPRKDKVWTTGPLVERMILALQSSGRKVPAYLSLAESEHSSRLMTAAFEMFCFWTGEMKLGRIEGVVTTEAGFIKGREVTRLRYDPSTISLAMLAAEALKADCARTVYLPPSDGKSLADSPLTVKALGSFRPAPDSDQKKQLAGIRLSELRLTPAQLTKLNAWMPVDRARALSFLSPAQRSRLAR